ncbi:MAG: UTP--glucose-1-phosphate uridylyltransferase, partial [Candidatus Omnitrophica bacterium]|nr:UTP--glucose-1-phosphate uridylyltransferase [Candidatus Omnitrophota bacterium]
DPETTSSQVSDYSSGVLGIPHNVPNVGQPVSEVVYLPATPENIKKCFPQQAGENAVKYTQRLKDIGVVLGEELDLGNPKQKQEAGKEFAQDRLGYVALLGGLATRFGEVIKAIFKAFRFGNIGRSFVEVKFAYMRYLEHAFGIRLAMANMNTYATADYVEAHIASRDYCGFQESQIISSHGGRITSRFTPRIDDLNSWIDSQIEILKQQEIEIRRKLSPEQRNFTSEDGSKLRSITNTIRGLEQKRTRWTVWLQKVGEAHPYKAGNPQDQYTPPGHGDVVCALLLDADGCCRPLLNLLQQGKDILQVANVDNLTGTPDAGLLRQFRRASTSADNFMEMQCELAMKYPGDAGGALALISLDGGQTWRAGLVEQFCFPTDFKHSDADSDDYIEDFNTATYLVNAMSMLRLLGIIDEALYREYKEAYVFYNKIFDNPRNLRVHVQEARARLDDVIQRAVVIYQAMSNEELRQKQEEFLQSNQLPSYVVYKTVRDRTARMDVPVVQMETLFGDLTSLLRTQFVRINRTRRFNPIKDQASIIKAYKTIRGFLGKFLRFTEEAFDAQESIERLRALERQGETTVIFGTRARASSITLEQASELVNSGRAVLTHNEQAGTQCLRLLYDQHNLLDSTGLPVESLPEGALLFDSELPPLDGQELDIGNGFWYPGVCLEMNQREIRGSGYRFDMLSLAKPEPGKTVNSKLLKYSGNYPAYVQVSKGEVVLILELYADQTRPGEAPLETKFVNLTHKERLIIPGGYSFRMVNAGSEEVVLSCWTNRLAVLNLASSSVPERVRLPTTFSSTPLELFSPFGFNHSEPLYNDFRGFNVKSHLDFLCEPMAHQHFLNDARSAAQEGESVAWYDPYNQEARLAQEQEAGLLAEVMDCAKVDRGQFNTSQLKLLDLLAYMR